MIFRYRNFIYDGADNREYAYDSNGNVTRDDNRGISSIEYNALGLPSRISVGSGSSIEYIYSADGIKLGSRYTEGRAASYALQAEQTEQSAQPYAYISEDYDYIGCYEFRNRNLFRVNTPYGYYLAGEFTPYMRDYQGNNRNEAGYYAYGLPASDSDVKSYDPYLYGDKMLYTLKGLNIYDFLARTYAPDIARFMQPDPLATENHGVSPYIYCLSDPLNFIDPTGEKVYYVDMTVRLISSEEAGTYNSLNMKEVEAQYEGLDVVLIIDKDGKIINQSETFEEGTINGTLSFPTDLPFCGDFKSIFTLFTVNGDDNAKSIFQFLSDNITATSGIEFGLNLMGESADGSVNDIFTGHTVAKLAHVDKLWLFRYLMGEIFREFDHSHKESSKPSPADKKFARVVSNQLFFKQDYIPLFNIYMSATGQYRSYNGFQ